MFVKLTFKGKDSNSPKIVSWTDNNESRFHVFYMTVVVIGYIELSIELYK